MVALRFGEPQLAEDFTVINLPSNCASTTEKKVAVDLNPAQNRSAPCDLGPALLQLDIEELRESRSEGCPTAPIQVAKTRRCFASRWAVLTNAILALENFSSRGYL